MLEQLRQRCLEDLLKTLLQGRLAEQAVGPSIRGKDASQVIEQQQAGPLAVEVVRA
ncbi:hypothetical protein D3C74_465510 [compost metagenome]